MADRVIDEEERVETSLNVLAFTGVRSARRAGIGQRSRSAAAQRARTCTRSSRHGWQRATTALNDIAR
jgi:hypothetical protein